MAQQRGNGIDPQRDSVNPPTGSDGACGEPIDQRADVMLEFQPPLQRMALQPETEHPVRMASWWNYPEEMVDLLG